MKKNIKFIPILILSLGLLPFFIHPFGAVEQAASNRPLFAGAEIDRETAASFARSCQDCHSERTVWPWYSYVPVASWLLERDVRRGRRYREQSLDLIPALCCITARTAQNAVRRGAVQVALGARDLLRSHGLRARVVSSAGCAFTTEFINARPDVAKRFAAGWAKAIDYIRANPAAARKHLAKNTLTPDDLVDVVPMLGYTMTKDMTPKQREELQTFADFGVQIGVVPEKIDVSKFVKAF